MEHYQGVVCDVNAASSMLLRFFGLKTTSCATNMVPWGPLQLRPKVT